MIRSCAVMLALLLCSCAHAAPVHTRPPRLVKANASIVPWPRVFMQYDAKYRWRGALEIHTAVDPALRNHRGNDAYILRVDGAGVHVRAASAAGAFYAVQTLQQLRETGGGTALPYVRVEDWPAYRWRGVHLDVSRHFFPLPVLERFVAAAAHYKLNVLHLHLTDDQAWRFHVSGAPRLASPQAYSDAEIARLVAYARARYVTVVPEVEMVSHNSAALRAYPAAAQTAAFYQAVLRDVIRLFPGRYVHAGGDEVQYSSGRRAFLQAVVNFLRVHNRGAVVWDDARDAGLTGPLTYMAWHPSAAQQRALAAHYDVVVTTDGPLYFDAYQGDRAQEPRAAPHMATLEQVYDYDPPTGPHVIGVQANLWTERIATERHLMYMAFPRELALAELAWDPPQTKDWDSFLARLPAQLQSLDARGITYRIPNVGFRVSGARFFPVAGNAAAAIARTNAVSAQVWLSVPMQRARVFYTMDGSNPTETSQEYTGAFTVDLSHAVIIRARARSSGGRLGMVSECMLERGLAGRTAGARAWASLISP